MEFLYLLVGLNLGLVVFLGTVVVYGIWRYSYLPFKAIRSDLHAANERFKLIESNIEMVSSLLKTRRSELMSDEERAAIERRMMLRNIPQ